MQYLQYVGASPPAVPPVITSSSSQYAPFLPQGYHLLVLSKAFSETIKEVLIFCCALQFTGSLLISTSALGHFLPPRSPLPSLSTSHLQQHHRPRCEYSLDVFPFPNSLMPLFSSFSSISHSPSSPFVEYLPRLAFAFTRTSGVPVGSFPSLLFPPHFSFLLIL